MNAFVARVLAARFLTVLCRLYEMAARSISNPYATRSTFIPQIPAALTEAQFARSTVHANRMLKS
jgi:hypothetical protein